MLIHQDAAPREFHVSRPARDRYQFDESLFTLNGTVIFANFHAARVFAQRMNQKRDLVNFPEQAVKASQINALALIHEITHYVFRLYREQKNPQLLNEMLASLEDQFGQTAVETTLNRFADQFPPLAVYRRETDLPTYLQGTTENESNREIMLEELVMLWLSNANPAFAPFGELFDDSHLEKESSYLQIIGGARSFFDSQPSFGGGAAGGENLLDFLLAPARASPHSLEGQLDFIRERWGVSLGRFIYRLLGSLDLIKEEERPVFFGGPGPIPIPVYGRGPQEGENFTQDRDWMPQLVMIAKNAYVWLDQLTKQYRRPIRSLADIPDEELDRLARAGLSGLWLIGLWERSAASKRIKQIMGNEDAVASAYSLYDYQIAAALGGEPAAQNLRDRAWQRGIRLASDMVPNHVGIDGRWVMQHPDWFVANDYSPFPSYSFSGPDLSGDDRVGVFLEDHYYSRSDAAVVFKRVDRHTGSEKYIYHGNDGTSMPWNDTAQLNYLNPEVREGVIQTILHVARQFPIIRFDAAMTLAKRHYHRLWFPEPGTGGDIASRSEHGMTKEQFDRLMPQEFWREVVDRCAVEAPDTLLLAEAFWLMESYFVRTLGMHRVYNSAFMHILRDEENGKYRMLMKNTLEFDPEILKRYVNFMNNPDERTAVDQFGKGDKYFGICSLMITLPGLPMFGHGQIEGFAEKYGMEYQRAYWNENPDQYLIERHEREIFPLLHKRYVFANVDNFLLYDFFNTSGSVNEDVFALSNRQGNERGLVIYHNKFADARGWIRTSAAYSVKTGNGDERRLVQKTLGEGLGLSYDDRAFCIFRDYVTNMEYIRSSKQLVEQGMYIELGAYKCHVFLDFREVYDDDSHQYADLAGYLNGRGVPSVEDALREIFLRPIHRPLRELVNADMFNRLTAVARDSGTPIAGDQATEALESEAMFADEVDELPDIADDLEDTARIEPSDDARAAIVDEVEGKMLELLRQIKAFTNNSGDEVAVVRDMRAKLEAILSLPALQRDIATDAPDGYRATLTLLNDRLSTGDPAIWGTVWSWLFVHNIGMIAATKDFEQQSLSWIDEWLLGRVISSALQQQGLDEGAASRATLRVKRLTSNQHWFETNEIDQTYRILERMLEDNAVRQLLGINRSQGVLWFNKEAFERMMWWMRFVAVVTISADQSRTPEEAAHAIAAAHATLQQLQEAADRSGYQVERLLVLTQV